MFKRIPAQHEVGDVKYFGETHVGEYFMFNGSEYVKKSSRTASQLQVNRVFYFKSNDKVKLTKVN